jgi:hypothetical protein
MALDPDRMRFSQQARRQVEDDDNRGLNCHGCIFFKRKADVCYAAADAARRMGLRDCDAVDPFGEAVIYIPYREIQIDLVDELSKTKG